MDFGSFKALLESDRSVRRFDGKREIGKETLERLVELTRYCASGRNLQPLRYRLVCGDGEREALFPLLSWAGYMPEWPGPSQDERPAAYLVQCLDTRITANCLCDDGLHLQAITLGAAALGIGGCIIKSFNARGVREALGIPEWAELRYVLALGYPAEKVRIEEFVGDVRYYRSSDGLHHVPKRPLSSLLM